MAHLRYRVHAGVTPPSLISHLIVHLNAQQSLQPGSFMEQGKFICPHDWVHCCGA